MKNNIYLNISVQIIFIFLCLMLTSFIPEMMPNFFGDWFCAGRSSLTEHMISYPTCTYGSEGYHNPEWHWGYRHWIFSFMGTILFIVQAFRIGNLIDKNNG